MELALIDGTTCTRDYTQEQNGGEKRARPTNKTHGRMRKRTTIRNTIIVQCNF